MSEPRVDADGFYLYRCSICDAEKIGALFTPAEIAAGSLRCRLCTGEVSQRHSKARRPTEAQQPRNVAVHTIYKQAPMIWRR